VTAGKRARFPSSRLLDAELAGPASIDHPTHILNRSTEMQLMHEDLARAHSAQRLEEAVRRERAHRLVVAHRAARRAEQAAMRARRLLASAVIG
jgi:hypothetical protein